MLSKEKIVNAILKNITPKKLVVNIFKYASIFKNDFKYPTKQFGWENRSSIPNVLIFCESEVWGDVSKNIIDKEAKTEK